MEGDTMLNPNISDEDTIKYVEDSSGNYISELERTKILLEEMTKKFEESQNNFQALSDRYKKVANQATAYRHAVISICKEID